MMEENFIFIKYFYYLFLLMKNMFGISYICQIKAKLLSNIILKEHTKEISIEYVEKKSYLYKVVNVVRKAGMHRKMIFITPKTYRRSCSIKIKGRIYFKTNEKNIRKTKKEMR